MVRPMINVSGIRDFQRQLRQMDADLPKKIRTTLNGSAELVVERTRPRVARRSGAAAASLKVRSSQREARVAAGGRRAPYYPWLDFGGRVGPGDSVQRPFLTEGRYVYPTVKDSRDEIQKIMSTGLAALARDAGLEIT